MTTGRGLDVLAIISVIVGVCVSLRPERPPVRPLHRGRTGEPGLWLLVVIAVIFTNQILFTLYILRVRHGDVSYIARYLPDGWFDIADHNRVLNGIAQRIPAAGLLAPTVLRVQAFLELPFVLLGYLTVARWFDQRLYRALTRPLVIWSAAATFTAAFILIEMHFPNPYTGQDVVIRGLSGLCTAALLCWWSQRFSGRRDHRVTTARDLLLFLASAACLGVGVLVVYDSALIFNLAHVGADAPIAAGAVGLLVLVRHLAARTVTAPAPLYREVLLTCLRNWLLLFFVAALPVRYALGFGSRWVALGAGGAVIITAAVVSLRTVAADRGVRVTSLLPRLAAAVAGAGVAALVSAYGSARYPEVRLLIAAVVFVGVTIAFAAWFDRAATAPPGNKTLSERFE